MSLACCLVDDSCVDTAFVCCDDIGSPSPNGEPACLGDGDGNGIDDACELSSPLIFYPTADTMISQHEPNLLCGAWEKMGVRNYAGGGGSTNWESDTLVRFDLSSLPPKVAVSSATLYVYFFMHWDSPPWNRDLTCHRVTSDWNENTTWNTRPTWTGQVTSTTTVPSYGWIAWDVTSDVQAFVGQEDNYGWVIMDETYFGQSDIPYFWFRTREHVDYVPYLEVVYTPVPAVSEWGMVAMTLLVLTAGTLVLRRRRAVRAQWPLPAC